MLIQIHPDNPDQRKLSQVVKVLQKGGVIVYPTDTVYALACDINSKSAVEKICQLRGIKPNKANFSIVCKDLSELTEFAKQVNNSTFRLMKKALPGPYTFILNASKKSPGIFRKSKKTIGIRIPNNNIALAIVESLGNPIMTASLKDNDDIVEYTTDPELIHENMANKVNLVIDGGFGQNAPSTIIDCSSGEPELIREGLGVVSLIF
ncbi:MAG: tRNA threonylcarbamoyl adenosine modification protein (Sua5/YciO/YrdC/YwlC family) [Saprospiraceae bacterium]|jgi:tRNA threonylcarbamoyl adenosine modification protein (Sua5/YciO/YrdC/YwlC family)